MTNKTTTPSPQQQRILDLLPAKGAELAAELGVSDPTVYAHIARLKEKGYCFSQDDTNRYHLAAVPGETDDEREESSYRPAAKAPKSAITRAKNDHLYELEQRLYELLEDTQPIIADGGLVSHESNEDIVVHISDDHIGSLRRDEHGNVTFDDEIAAERIRARTDKIFELADREERAGTVIDTVHLVHGGDLVDGEGIYEMQPHEVCLTLDKQIDLAVGLYFEAIYRTAKRFPAVQVVCQSGNHGELRMKSASQGANADTIVYLMLRRLIASSDLDNVTFIHNEAANFVNFPLRGGKWTAHVRHGQNAPAHIGTPSPKNKWANWQIQHGFDIAYRGHYHEFRVEHITGRSLADSGIRKVPVIMSGSIAPPADYEESLGVWGSPAGTIHGVTDDRVLSWLYPLEY